MSRPIRILAFWGASDFVDFLTPAFLDRPEYEVEIVSGDRSSGPCPHKASLGRLLSLRRRLKAGEFDLVIAGNIWNSAWPMHKGLWTKLPQAMRYLTYKRSMLDCWWAPWLMRGLTDRIPFAVLDLRDPHFVIPNDLPLLESCTHYFKRELFAWPRRSLLPLSTFFSAKRIEPLEAKFHRLSYGVLPKHIPPSARPMAERDVDLYVSGFGNPVRNRIKEKCRALTSQYKVVIVDNKTPTRDYMEYLQRTRLVVCTESYGCETWRQYEAAAAGAIALLGFPFVQHHKQMLPDEHAIYFSPEGDDFERQIARALSNPELLDKVSQQGREFVLAHKDRRRIADYIVTTCLQK